MSPSIITLITICFITVVLSLKDLKESTLIWPPPVTNPTPPSPPTPTVVYPTPQSPSRNSPFRTNFGEWRTCGDTETACACFGFLRVGDGRAFTAPLAVSGIFECGIESARSMLWKDFSPATAVCEVLQPERVQLVTPKGCMIPPPDFAGWTGPGLINDCSGVGWVYHKASGQLRLNGQCLTAVVPPELKKPKELKKSEKSTNVYAYQKATKVKGNAVIPQSLNATNQSNLTSDHSWIPWNVFLSPCSQTADPDSRQAWDLPRGSFADSGELNGFTFAEKEELPGGVIGQKIGGSGQITLRDSHDIGFRCLEISTPMTSANALPRRVDGHPLAATICSDFTRKENLLFSVFRFEKRTTEERWKKCNTIECSECTSADCQIRMNQGGKNSQPISWTDDHGSVAVASGLLGNSKAVALGPCGLESLKKMAMPDLGSVCSCQATTGDQPAWEVLRSRVDDKIPSVSRLGTLAQACSDDLP